MWYQRSLIEFCSVVAGACGHLFWRGGKASKFVTTSSYSTVTYFCTHPQLYTIGSLDKQVSVVLSYCSPGGFISSAPGFAFCPEVSVRGKENHPWESEAICYFKDKACKAFSGPGLAWHLCTGLISGAASLVSLACLRLHSWLRLLPNSLGYVFWAAVFWPLIWWETSIEGYSAYVSRHSRCICTRVRIRVCFHLNDVTGCSAVQKLGAALPASVKLPGMYGSETRVSVKTIMLIFIPARIFTEKKKKKIVLCGV